MGEKSNRTRWEEMKVKEFEERKATTLCGFDIPQSVAVSLFWSA